jgi:predicted ATP-grasp superfamily ATP-dependent carboligase
VLSQSRTAVGARTARDGESFDVLVLDAATRQSLACTRSLGRAGLRVATAECFAECDPALPVLSFRSRYCSASVVLPSFFDALGYAEGVLEFVRRHPTRVVVPASDGSIAALLPRRSELEATGCRLALSSSEALSLANDKAITLSTARRLGIEGPRTVRVDSPAELPVLLENLSFPFVLKPTTSWSGRASLRLRAVDVVDVAEAERVVTEFASRGVGALGQVWIPGRREGVTLFLVDGEVRAAFAHVEWRTTPALGGASVVRESIAMPDDLRTSSIELVRTLGLEGLSEVEFRRDASGRPMLMEINARMAGTIESAVACGVDFPSMLWRWSVGQPVGEVTSYDIGRRMRWLRGDMRWLRDNHRRIGRPDGVSRARGVATFTAEFLRSSHYDSFDARDVRPALAELRTTLAAVHQSWRRPQHECSGAGEEVCVVD